MTALADRYQKEIVPEVQKTLNTKNPMEVPRLLKIVINSSMRDYLQDKKNLEKAKEEIALIAGQQPKIARAKISVATFKLREGDPIGIVVTLRGRRMYDFFEKLVTIVFPRMRDFSGIDEKGFDGRGNLTLGFNEHTVFPEIDSGKVDRLRGLQIIFVTNAGKNDRAKALMEGLGMPFKKKQATS